MRTATRLLTLPILLALGTVAGCTVAGPGSKDPGPEELAPVDGKADSFRNPTEHGDLRFGNASTASITDEEMFHSWTFELTGDADVSLAIQDAAQNLDTVMYLYRRDAGSELWGSYIARNDDANGSMLSAIEKSLNAGQYRVLIKGYKEYHRGRFSLVASCDGRGCGTLNPTDVDIPAATGFSESCVSAIQTAMTSATFSSDTFEISPTATTGFPREVLLANAMYADLSDWREYADPEDEFHFEAEYVKLEDGAIVIMADGGDESTTEYLFDGAGKALAYYVHNQSPWVEYYCGQEGDEAADEPSEDCIPALTSNGPHDPDNLLDVRGSWVPGGANDALDPLMRAAVARYIEAELDGEEAEISIEGYSWEGRDGGKGAELTLLAEGDVTVSYTVVGDDWNTWVAFEASENGEGTVMVCKSTR